MISFVTDLGLISSEAPPLDGGEGIGAGEGALGDFLVIALSSGPFEAELADGAFDGVVETHNGIFGQNLCRAARFVFTALLTNANTTSLLHVKRNNVNTHIRSNISRLNDAATDFAYEQLSQPIVDPLLINSQF